MRTRYRMAVGAAAVLLLAAGGGAAVTTVVTPDPRAQPARAESGALGRSAPVRLVVPKLGLDAEIRSLALTADGELEAPPRAGVAGWYARGTSPGEPGSAVIIGHARGLRGDRPVFAGLARLAPGDQITVARADRTVARFAVERVAPYSPVDRGPGRAGQASLRLVPAEPTGSPSPPVVFAVLVP